jgi:hypothetical protein
MNPVGKSVTVDRIEGGFAVLTDGDTQCDMPIAWLPAGVAEGSAIRFALDPEAEAGLLSRVQDALSSLKSKDSSGGSIDL